MCLVSQVIVWKILWAFKIWKTVFGTLVWTPESWTGSCINITSLALQQQFETIYILKYCRQVGRFCKPKAVLENWGTLGVLVEQGKHATLAAVETPPLKLPLGNHRTSEWCSNLISPASISLHISENIWSFFENERMKFTIFMTSMKINLETWLCSVFLHQSLNHKCFSMNHVMSWNYIQG